MAIIYNIVHNTPEKRLLAISDITACHVCAKIAKGQAGII